LKEKTVNMRWGSARLPWIAAVFPLLIFSQPAFADPAHRYALVLGGGGDPPGPSTIFDSEFITLADRLNKAHYQSTVFFDGGHALSEKEASAAFGKKVAPFTAFDAKKAIAGFIQDIHSKKIHAGDQLLITIDTHGAPGEPNGFHKVATSGAQDFNVGSLQTLRDAAEKAGVKLAIVDMSCYSGTSLKLATPATCVLTSAPENQEGFTAAPQALYSAIVPGVSLENIFLTGRNSSTDAGYPEISTPQGQAAKEALDVLHTGIEIFAKKPLFESDQELKCENSASPQFQEKLETLWKALPSVYGVSQESVDELIREVANYKQIRAQSIEDMHYLRTELKIDNVSVPLEVICNIDQAEKNFKHLLQGNLPVKLRARVTKILSFVPQLRAKRDELLKTDDHFRRVSEDQQAEGEGNSLRPQKVDRLAEAAIDISISERTAYDAVYRQTSDTGANPCRDFKF
jgi:hypothetical protein